MLKQNKDFHLIVFTLFFAANLTGCATSSGGQLQTSDRIVEKVSVDVPVPPPICQDPNRSLPIEKDQASMLVYLFTEEHCDACGRELIELNNNAKKLEKHKVLVIQAVTQTGDSCFNAAKLARKSPWPYAAVNTDTERNWAVRSTPTMWLVNPRTDKTIAYVEGEMGVDDLLDFIPQS